MTIAEDIIRAKEDLDAVYAAGKQAEYDRFWDTFQQNGNRTNYANAFFNLGWNDETYQPKYNIVIVGNGYACMSYSIITNTKVNIDISKATSVTNFFAHCIRLNTIQKLVVSEDITYNGMFSGCTALENITIEGVIGNDIDFKDCSKLTHDSLMSIINALKPLVTYEEVVTDYTNYYLGDGVPEEFWTFDTWCEIDREQTTDTELWFYMEAFEEMGWLRIFESNHSEITNVREFIGDATHVRINSGGGGFSLKSTKAIPTGETKTLTLGSTNLAKLTNEEKAIATNKGWKLA